MNRHADKNATGLNRLPGPGETITRSIIVRVTGSNTFRLYDRKDEIVMNDWIRSEIMNAIANRRGIQVEKWVTNIIDWTFLWETRQWEYKAVLTMDRDDLEQEIVKLVSEWKSELPE